MKFVPFLILFFLSSCAGYVNQMHRQFDRNDKALNKKRPTQKEPTYAAYRKQDRFRPEDDKRPVKNPITYSLGSDSSRQQKLPPVKREYRQQRYQAQDFIDEGSSGSLWIDQGSSSSLFTYQNDKHTGDLVIINVLEDLRNQISSELKRTFPDKPKKAGKGKEVAKEEDKKSATPDPAGASGQAENEMDMKVYDKVSGTVMEEVSKDYIVLRGRKDVIFKKEKRSIEIQALVSRKDIMENDYVNSDKLLESRVYILRGNQ